MQHARAVARKVMSFDSERQVMHYLREETRKIVPEAFEEEGARGKWQGAREVDERDAPQSLAPCPSPPAPGMNGQRNVD
jgi:hypothetical protein